MSQIGDYPISPNANMMWVNPDANAAPSVGFNHLNVGGSYYPNWYYNPYPNWWQYQQPSPCPSCGHCPSCGQRRAPYTYQISSGGTLPTGNALTYATGTADSASISATVWNPVTPTVTPTGPDDESSHD